MIHTECYKSPVGYLIIRADETAVIGIDISDEAVDGRGNDVTHEAVRQLRQFFAGKRERFDLPIRLDTTPFRKRVYEALMKVPYGSTVSYRDLTYMAGNRRGFQATGQAMHFNPIMIVIPCHRVINSDGTIGGYGRHLEIKKHLLNMESGKEIW